jgi:hypothetical protein
LSIVTNGLWIEIASFRIGTSWCFAGIITAGGVFIVVARVGVSASRIQARKIRDVGCGVVIAGTWIGASFKFNFIAYSVIVIVVEAVSKTIYVVLKGVATRSAFS